MNKNILPKDQIDVIALLTRHQADFERLQQEIVFSSLSAEHLLGTFEDGKYDGEIDVEPEPTEWAIKTYRNGYLTGVASRFDESSIPLRPLATRGLDELFHSLSKPTKFTPTLWVFLFFTNK